ncbi:PREDICTED: uncharacterized protein LOC104595715 [Nelumbo nucifera]|uniref:Uncharacterized protein LOC104595715 n=1 Tax=Nelumbo nucifera TaxID=4432 RepID=A0A1U7ZPD5_NELNU|nr:PREDICTED: uncharacterized protein LOC104595715 [Nelumbo nucifera]
MDTEADKVNGGLQDLGAGFTRPKLGDNGFCQSGGVAGHAYLNTSREVLHKKVGNMISHWKIHSSSSIMDVPVIHACKTVRQRMFQSEHEDKKCKYDAIAHCSLFSIAIFSGNMINSQVFGHL